MTDAEIEERIFDVLQRRTFEGAYAELRRLYAVERRYAPTDGCAESTEELLAAMQWCSPSIWYAEKLEQWACSWRDEYDSHHTIYAPTARAALIAALKEGE